MSSLVIYLQTFCQLGEEMAACANLQHRKPGPSCRGSNAGLVHHGRVRVPDPAQRRPQLQAGPFLLAVGRLRILHPISYQVRLVMSLFIFTLLWCDLSLEAHFLTFSL